MRQDYDDTIFSDHMIIGQLQKMRNDFSGGAVASPEPPSVVVEDAEGFHTVSLLTPRRRNVLFQGRH